MSATVREFLQAWQKGELCLHPTDTLPGLSFNPAHPTAKEKLARFKGRPQDKPFIGLVAGLEHALDMWQELPAPWQRVLAELWPGSLTVVWYASEKAPKALISADGSIALRYPHFSSDKGWMNALLQAIASPLPTTSVNKSGEPPLTSWDAALKAVANNPGLYCPTPSIKPVFSVTALPSTLIKLQNDGAFSLLRQGAVSRQTITLLLAAF